jgi:hypothetical protein
MKKTTLLLILVLAIYSCQVTGFISKRRNQNSFLEKQIEWRIWRIYHRLFEYWRL